MLLSLLHGATICVAPSIAVIALGIWWNSNTVAHYFVHLPFFRGTFWNRCFSAYQTLLLGIPQRLWRDRHLAHHANRPWQLRWSGQLAFEISLVISLWTLLLLFAPQFMLTTYWPGYLVGLALCYCHGYFEHTEGTTSHYGRVYNRLCFNDGYHIEHHAHPGAHWRSLPAIRTERSRQSRWPAILRWLEKLNLNLLERLVLNCPPIREFLVNRHRRAFERLLLPTDRIRSVGVVGGGLFPRTALVLRGASVGNRLRIKVIEASAAHIEIAKLWTGPEIEYVHARFDSGYPEQFDLLVIPLAYDGSRDRVIAECHAKVILVHDWIWHRADRSAVVSWLLLKRLNRYDP